MKIAAFFGLGGMCLLGHIQDQKPLFLSWQKSVEAIFFIILMVIMPFSRIKKIVITKSYSKPLLFE